MTRQELRNKLARALDADITSPGSWTTGELNQIIAEAFEVFCEQAEPIERHVNIPLKAGHIYYRLSSYASDIILPLRLIDPINEQRLTPTTIIDLDNRHDRWETTTGSYPQYWAPLGWDWIAIWPHKASDGGMLRLEYSAWGMDVVDDSDYLELDEEDEDAILTMAYGDANLWDWKEELAAGAFKEFFSQLRAGRGRAQRKLGFKFAPF